MKTKLDELLEKWQMETNWVELHFKDAARMHRWIAELTTIKDSLNDGVGTSPPCTDADRARGIRLKPHEVCLEAWMREVTNTLFFLTSVPQSQKDSTGYAFNEYCKSIGKP